MGAARTAATDSPIRRIVASYDDRAIRLYSRVRFTILRQTFLEEIGQYLPREGRILDLGCGFGLFSLYFASVAPARTLVGVDRDRRRIEIARTSAERLSLKNVEYHAKDALLWNAGDPFHAVYALDLIHHLPRESVRGFLLQVRTLLRPGGVLLLKDVEDRPRWKMWFTLALDRLMVGGEPIHYWSAGEMRRLLEDDLGFDVARHRMKDVLPYPHVLYVCRRPA